MTTYSQHIKSVRLVRTGYDNLQELKDVERSTLLPRGGESTMQEACSKTGKKARERDRFHRWVSHHAWLILLSKDQLQRSRRRRCVWSAKSCRRGRVVPILAHGRLDGPGLVEGEVHAILYILWSEQTGCWFASPITESPFPERHTDESSCHGSPIHPVSFVWLALWRRKRAAS